MRREGNSWKILLTGELITIFIIMPIALRVGVLTARPLSYLLFGLIYCFLVLKLDREFNWGSLKVTRSGMRPLFKHSHLLLMAFLVAAAFVFTYLVEPERFLGLPRERTQLWIVILFLYPFLSAYPQEIVYRVFFFHRYKPLIGEGFAAIALNSLLFGFSHLVFATWISVGLTALGGLIFSVSYLKTKNVAFPFFQHSILGLSLFTAGLGRYFYKVGG